MVWFKVDDKFHSHPKRYRCSLAAIGLWSVAGSWCGDQERDDGLVPAHMVSAFGGNKKHAAELVTAGLWDEVDGGWRFHDWTDRNPSEAQIKAKREAEAERKRKWREALASRRDKGGTDAGTAASVPAESALTRSRPDPDPEVLTPLSGDRYEPLRAVDATKLTQKPGSPADARCTAHVGVADPGPCKGCRAAREKAERDLETENRRDLLEAERLSRNCDRCDGHHVTDDDGRPTRQKCNHRKAAS